MHPTNIVLLSQVCFNDESTFQIQCAETPYVKRKPNEKIQPTLCGTDSETSSFRDGVVHNNRKGSWSFVRRGEYDASGPIRRVLGARLFLQMDECFGNSPKFM